MSNDVVKSGSLPSRKFYFLDYFYIFLSSVEKNISYEDVFSSFKILKQKHRLGESKYKKLEEVDNPTEYQQRRYRYTFNKVADECIEYGLVEEKEANIFYLTSRGSELLNKHRKEGVRNFNLTIFELMENAHYSFRTLVEFLYEANPKGSGALVFPHYSPLELNFRRSDTATTKDIINYSEALIKKLQGDIEQYLKKKMDLTSQNEEIIKRLIADNLLPEVHSERFDSKDYNKITKRIRDFWLTYFLKDIYHCPFSMTSFDLWCYRAKQIDVVQATESYPFINGKLVYPTSVVFDEIQSEDFTNIYKYKDGKFLFVHKPKLANGDDCEYKDKFVATLVKGYFDLKRHVRYNFINLISLREVVCLKLKISMHMFEEILNEIYRLNLAGRLNIRISLEVDKLPEETSVMYLKHEPVMVDGSYRNIIAIDVTGGGKSNE